ncbi:2'-5' RNA ligase family protein [Nocardioides montaniterrae]
MGHSVLVVAVPPLEDFVRARWEHHDPRWVSHDPAFTHAHVTVLAPLPEVPTEADLALLAAVASSARAFDFELTTIESTPGGLIHAQPKPREPFDELTSRVREAFPHLQPYAGAFDPVPHVTLDHCSTGVTVADVERALGEVLPAYVVASRLELHRYAEGDCRVLHTWPLGG